MRYRERVYPRATTLFVLILFVIMISIAYAAALSQMIGWIMFLAGTVFLILALWFSSPIITVHDDHGVTVLTVGKASIPQGFLDDPRILDRSELKQIERGHVGDTAFLTIRGNLPAVALSITDPDDPHELWVFSSRKPFAVISSLRSDDVTTPH
jgi:Protein of unknown function (DUF3093)